jgi:hypothetical protein
MLIESGKRPDERNVISASRVDLPDASRLQSLYDRVFEKEQGGRLVSRNDPSGVGVEWEKATPRY